MTSVLQLQPGHAHALQKQARQHAYKIHVTDLAFSAQIAEEIQGLCVVGHNHNAIIGFCAQHCQHACHEGKLARQQLPSQCQATSACSAIVKQSRGKELATPLYTTH